MANLTIGKIVSNLKNPAIVAGGFMIGMATQKAINKMLNSETVVNGLGAEAASTLRDYASPLITSVIGVSVSIMSESDLVKKLSTGVAISGAVGVGMKAVWGKNLLDGTVSGLLGSIMGDDEILGVDDDDIEGIDDDIEGLEEEEETIAALDIPFDPPALRDTNYERESISGYDGYGVIM